MAKELPPSPPPEKEAKESCFGWRYFHFVGKDGISANLVLHETDIFGLRREPYFSLSYLTPRGQPAHFANSTKEAIVRESSGKADLYLPFGNNVIFEGEMAGLSHPLVIEGGVLYKDAFGRTSNWRVEIPHGRFRAVIHEGNKKTEFEGVGYEDRQWGTLPIQEFVSDWVWGHFSDEEISVIFFKILTKEGLVIDRAGFVNNSIGYGGASCRADYLKNLALDSQPDMARFVGKVECPDFKTKIMFEINPENLMRSRVGEDYSMFKASYLRWASKGLLSFGSGSRLLSGVTEYLRIRK